MADELGLTPEELAAEPTGGHKFSSLGKGTPIVDEEEAYKLAKESAAVAAIPDKEYIDSVKQELMATGESPTADSRQAVIFADEEGEETSLSSILGDSETPLSDILRNSNTASDDYIKESARDAFILRRLQHPEEDINDLWNRTVSDVANSGDPRSLVAEERIRFGNNEYTQAMTLAMEAVRQGDPDALEFAQRLMNDPSLYTEYYAEGDSVIPAIASTAPPSYKEWQIREEAATHEIAKTLTNWSEQRGVLDKVVDVAGLLLIPDTAVDIKDLMQEGIIDSVQDFYADLKRFHYELTPEQRVEQFNAMFPRIVEAFDNNEFKIAGVVSMFLDKDLAFTKSTIGVNIAFDLATGFDAWQLLKGYSAYRKARNLGHTYKKAGRVDESARAAVAASASDEAANTVGMNKGEAVASASPIEYEDVIPNSIDGIAARIHEVKEQTVKTIKQDLFGWSANKMSREDEKILRGTKRDLQVQLAKLKEELKEFPESAGGTRKSREKAAAARAAIKDQIKDAEGRIKVVDDELKLNNRYASAEAELSRLQQGIYSPAIKAQIDEAVEAELELMRKAARDGDTPPETAPVAPRDTTEPQDVRETEGLTGEFVDELEESIIGPIQRLSLGVLKPSVVSPKARAAAVKRVEEKLQAQAQAEGTTFANAKVTHMDDQGFKMEYELDGNGETFEHVWTRNDAGTWVSEDTNPDTIRSWVNSGAGKVIFSPSRLIEKLNSGLVDTFTFAGQQSATIRNGLGRIWKDAEEGLSAKDIELVDNLLFLGDEWVDATGSSVGKVFTPAELRHGIESRIGTIALDGMDNADEIMRSYYKKRAFYDELHRIRDTMTRRNLEVKGFKNLDYVQEGALKKAVVKPLDRWEFPDADASDHVVDLSTGKLNKESLNQVGYLRTKSKEYKEAEYKVVELLEPVRVGETKVKYGIVKEGGDTKIGGLPSRVLNYSPGYVPRIYAKGMYFVKNGNSEFQETLYAFRSRQEAKAWADRVELDEADKPAGERIVPIIREDRALNQNELLLEESVGYGGLYTGSRKRTPIMVREGDNLMRPDRISTSEATERYLNNLADAMPVNEFREFAMQEWVNTVNALAKMTKSGNGVRTFDGKIDIDSRYAVVLEQTRDYLKRTLGIPTKEERHTHGWMLGIANMMEGKKFLAKPRQMFIDNADKDITRQLKAYTFDLTMGWFNPRQLFVQSQNASLAASMYPQHALPAFLDTMKMRTLIHMSEERIAEAAKKLGYGDDLVDSLIGFKRAGLEDAIVRTADFNPVRAGVGHSSLRSFRKAAKLGRVFYEEGELAARLMSWSIARRKLGKGASVEEISKESVRMHMNLQSENAAWWQNAPVIGMATQFLQVQAKFIENVMPKILGGSGKWSGREKASALAGQILLYGTSGVFIAEGLTAWLAEESGMSIDEFERAHPNVAESVQEGFVGTILSLLGAKDINATEAVSLVAGLDDNVVADLLKAAAAITHGGYKEGVDVADVTFGPTLSTLTRGKDALAGMAMTVKALTHSPSGEELADMMLNNLDQVLSMTSSWNNVKKMKLLQRHEVLLGREGQKIANLSDLGDLSPLEYLVVGMGFSTDAEVAHYRQKDFMQDIKKERTDLRKALLKNYKEFLQHGNLELYHLQRGLLLESSDLTPIEKLKVDESVTDAMIGKSAIEKQAGQFLTELIKSGGRLEIAPGQSQLIQGEDIDG